MGMGLLATGVGVWVQIGLPTFKDAKQPDPPKTNNIRIIYGEDTNGMAEQKILIPTEGDTTEIHAPVGPGKMIEIGN